MALPQTQNTASRPAAGALQGLTHLPVLKQLGVMVGLAASVALGVAAILWFRTPSYGLLYGTLSSRETGQVVDALDRAGIPYRLDSHSGAVLIPGNEIPEARMKLAAEGLPKSSDPGFEILQQDSGFGTSQFLERARYQRALEVELARSISSLDNVKSARVHLAVPKQSVFVRDRVKPSASVLVDLYAGRTLDESQVAAIAYLTAASVPNLQPSEVRIVDQKGQLLTPADQSRDAVLTQKQFDYTRHLETYYIKRIEDILSPMVGPSGVRAQVVADVDFTRTEQTREAYEPNNDPKQMTLRSEQVVEERGGGSAPAGVPGALSNQPPGAASVPETSPANPQAGGTAAGEQAAGRSSRRSTRNFEVDRTLSHTQAPAASLRRLSVAVVLDDLRVKNDAGEPVRRSLKPEELDRYKDLVKEAIGYDEKRGDSLSVVNMAFTEPPAVLALPAPPIWEQGWIWDVGRQLMGVAMVLFLVFGVLRPAMRRLTAHEVKAQRLAAVPAVDGGEVPEDQLSLTNGRPSGARLTDQSQRRERVGALHALVEEDPKRVAQVVRNWVNQDE